MTEQEQIENANATLAREWYNELQYAGVDLVDVLQYETLRVLGAQWKDYRDMLRKAELEQAQQVKTE